PLACGGARRLRSTKRSEAFAFGPSRSRRTGSHLTGQPWPGSTPRHSCSRTRTGLGERIRLLDLGGDGGFDTILGTPWQTNRHLDKSPAAKSRRDLTYHMGAEGFEPPTFWV